MTFQAKWCGCEYPTALQAQIHTLAYRAADQICKVPKPDEEEV